MPWAYHSQRVALKGQKKLATMKEFDLILLGITDENKIEHLFIVDIEFHQKNAAVF